MKPGLGTLSDFIILSRNREMKDKDEILEEIRALSESVEKERNDFCLKAIRLADAVVRNRDTIRDLKGTIGGPICDLIEADERYEKAVEAFDAACERLRKCLKRGRKRGAR